MMADNQTASLFGPTPWQTVGPFFHYALPWLGCADLEGASLIGARPDLIVQGHELLYRAPDKGVQAGERIEIFGRVLDGDGNGVPDALIEIWQADAAGRYAVPSGAKLAFYGFGRCATAEDGSYRFVTIKPGAVVGPDDAVAAPHIAVSVLGRGILKRLVTRMYFADEAANDDDAVLALVPAERRATLLADRAAQGYRFDIRLQGAGETVFFQC
jgi:protocatechuate 3,4-dioxygenase alpha subunit